LSIEEFEALTTRWATSLTWPVAEDTSRIESWIRSTKRLKDRATGQITLAFGDVVHGPAHGMKRLHQQANQHAQQGDDQDHGDDRGDHRRAAELAEHGVGLGLVHAQTDVPVHRRQALDLGEGDDGDAAIAFDFGHVIADARGVLRVHVLE
jgi:hypothetical protein